MRIFCVVVLSFFFICLITSGVYAQHEDDSGDQTITKSYNDDNDDYTKSFNDFSDQITTNVKIPVTVEDTLNGNDVAFQGGEIKENFLNDDLATGAIKNGNGEVLTGGGYLVEDSPGSDFLTGEGFMINDVSRGADVLAGDGILANDGGIAIHGDGLVAERGGIAIDGNGLVAEKGSNALQGDVSGQVAISEDNNAFINQMNRANVQAFGEEVFGDALVEAGDLYAKMVKFYDQNDIPHAIAGDGGDGDDTGNAAANGGTAGNAGTLGASGALAADMNLAHPVHSGCMDQGNGDVTATSDAVRGTATGGNAPGGTASTDSTGGNGGNAEACSGSDTLTNNDNLTQNYTVSPTLNVRVAGAASLSQGSTAAPNNVVMGQGQPATLYVQTQNVSNSLAGTNYTPQP